MSTRQRLHRLDPERNRPIRNWSTLLKYGGSGEKPGNEGEGADPFGADGSAGRDAIGDGVRTGYRVIEEYLRHGQSVAKLMGGASFGGSVATDAFREAMERTTRGITELASLWLAQVAPSFGNAGLGSPVWPGVPQAAVPTPDRSVRVRVSSPTRTEVGLDLQPVAAGRSLACHPLHSAIPQAPPLTAVAFERLDGTGALCLNVDVPAAQPSGVYSGVVVDTDAGVVLGTLTVRIWDRT